MLLCLNMKLKAISYSDYEARKPQSYNFLAVITLKDNNYHNLKSMFCNIGSSQLGRYLVVYISKP